MRNFRAAVGNRHICRCPKAENLWNKKEYIGDWVSGLPMRKGCDDLDFLHEALYHISNDYFLSYYLQWPLVEDQGIENPFRPHFDLWKMGLTAQFFHHDQIALIDC